MRRRVRTIGNLCSVIAIAAALAVTAPVAWAARSPRSAPARPASPASQLALRSPDLDAGGTIPRSQVYDRSGCNGGNLSPALAWNQPPAGTRSFAVLMFDTDAPGGAWWHWAVFDIPAGVRLLRAGSGDPAKRLLPAGAIQVRNEWGSPGYGGPCPPPGPPHHYHLALYALPLAKLGLGASASAAQVASRVRAYALAESEIVAVYSR